MLARKDPPKKPKTLVNGYKIMSVPIKSAIFYGSCADPCILSVIQANWADLMLLFARRIGIDMSTDASVKALRNHKVVSF